MTSFLSRPQQGLWATYNINKNGQQKENVLSTLKFYDTPFTTSYNQTNQNAFLDIRRKLN